MDYIRYSSEVWATTLYVQFCHQHVIVFLLNDFVLGKVLTKGLNKTFHITRTMDLIIDLKIFFFILLISYLYHLLSITIEINIADICYKLSVWKKFDGGIMELNCKCCCSIEFALLL